MKIRLKRNESFYIRDGWFEKSLYEIKTHEDQNIFYKNDGVKILGIGTNMVKGLKYWLKASGIINPKNTENDFTEFGRILCEFDPYLESKFSWFFIHYFLVMNRDECPIFYEVFNNSRLKSFNKKELAETLTNTFKEEDETVRQKFVEADLGVFTKSYVNEAKDVDPEDNYRCPLSNLKLMKKDGDIYTKTSVRYSDLSYLVVYYVLKDMYLKEDSNLDKVSFEIEESMAIKNNPTKVFNLDKVSYYQYLDEMKRAGLITVNKTAGLNMVYFEKNLSLSEVFEMYFSKK